MFELFERGGIMMYPLALSSILMIAIIFERFISLRKNKILIPEIINIVKQFKSREDLEMAQKICGQYNGPLPNLVLTGLNNYSRNKSEIKEVIEDQGRQEIRKLEKGLGILETIASVAPLMGLTGTVLGMIRVFNVIKVQGIGQAAALSGGISEALLTTVTGLFIGMPALIFFNYFSHKAENFVLDIEKNVNDLIQKIQNLNNK